jgi:hypothetical protein
MFFIHSLTSSPDSFLEQMGCSDAYSERKAVADFERSVVKKRAKRHSKAEPNR